MYNYQFTVLVSTYRLKHGMLKAVNNAANNYNIKQNHDETVLLFIVIIIYFIITQKLLPHLFSSYKNLGWGGKITISLFLFKFH